MRGGIDHLGMRHVPAPVEYGGFAEDDELLFPLQHVLHPLDAVEPHEIYAAGLIRKLCREPFGALLAHHLHVGDAPAQLDVTAVLYDVGNVVNMRLVDVPIGIIVQQVLESVDSEFFAEHFRSLGSNTFQELYRGLQNVILIGHGCLLDIEF